MKKKILISLILIHVIINFGYGQIGNSKNIYFDENCNLVQSQSYASFVAVCVFHNDTLSTTDLVTVYKYPSMTKLSEGYYESISPYRKPIDGIVKYYFPNGQVKSYQTFRNGKLNGEYRNYYKNGQIWEIGNCINGIINGPYTLYWDNGNLQETGTDENGYEVGTRKKWNYLGFYIGEFDVPYGTPSVNMKIWENAGVCQY